MINSTDRLDTQTTVNDAILRFPLTLPVFREFGIDSCCGGPLSIAVAATRHGHDVDDVMKALHNAMEQEWETI